MLDNSPVVAGIICQISAGSFGKADIWNYINSKSLRRDFACTLLQRRHDYLSRDASGLQAGPVDMQLPPYFARETRGSRVGEGPRLAYRGLWRGRLATSKPNRDDCGQAKSEFGDWRTT
jgi:hypothetical protein